jgi:hypothetical protein
MKSALASTALWVALALAGVAAGADQPEDGRERGTAARPPAGSTTGGAAGGSLDPVQPTVPSRVVAPPDTTVKAPVRRRSAKAASWPAWLPRLSRASGRDGRADLIVDGQAQAVQAGSSVGALEAVSVTPERLVMVRRAASGEAADTLVIVTFDAQGVARAQVLLGRDPRARVGPEVR